MAKLSPSQQEAFKGLLEGWEVGSVFVVWSNKGLGKSTILKELHRVKGGHVVTLKTYIDELRNQNPLQMEETLEHILMRALDKSDLVIMDDLDLLNDVMCGCNADHYPRQNFGDAIYTSIVNHVVAAGKKIVFGNEGSAASPIARRCYYGGLNKFVVADYEFLCKAYLGKRAKVLDFAKIFRFAPKLNGHQLKTACLWMHDRELDTEKFIEYLRSQRMTSNVDLDEVEAVDLRSLKGLDDIIESLEANIIVPLEHDDLATEFGIKSKRGVLLAGPPGTGKTTVGRALAHRLRSKFFLVDGTFISGTSDFYSKIHRVFEAAKNNAPSIIFIDDSDVIFENKDDFGLYRYLLTMLDGLESESNKRVCIMMTTMDVSSVPRALVRSGRIELWLETRLPDRDARLSILQDHAVNLNEELRSLNLEKLADETEDLTGADLKRLIEDGKILYAYDRARKLPVKEVDTYFERATETIRSNKEKYADAEAQSHRNSSDDGDSLRMARRFAAYARRFQGGDDDNE